MTPCFKNLLRLEAGYPALRCNNLKQNTGHTHNTHNTGTTTPPNTRGGDPTCWIRGAKKNIQYYIQFQPIFWKSLNIYIFTLGWALLQLNTSSTVIINNKTTFGANAWRCEPLRPRSGLARLGTAKAPSNGRIKPRVPAKDLPKRLGPLWCSVIIISVSTRPRRETAPAAWIPYINLYIHFFSAAWISIFYFFWPPAEYDIIFNSGPPYEYVNMYSTRREETHPSDLK